MPGPPLYEAASATARGVCEYVTKYYGTVS
jgi:hypothetical protein